MQKKYRAVAFDLDGTLLNTLEDLQDAVNYALQNLGYAPRSIDEIRSFVGNGIPKLVERALPDGIKSSRDFSIIFQNAYALFTSYYKIHSADKTKPYEGMVALLHLLKGKGVPMALITNKAEPAAQILCGKFFGEGTFTIVVGGREGMPNKPAPDGLNIALDVMGATASQTLYVGDSDVDFQTAKNGKCDCALVSWGFRPRKMLEEFHPTVICDTAENLQEFILQNTLVKGE